MATNTPRCTCAFCTGLNSRPRLFADQNVTIVDERNDIGFVDAAWNAGSDLVLDQDRGAPFGDRFDGDVFDLTGGLHGGALVGVTDGFDRSLSGFPSGMRFIAADTSSWAPTNSDFAAMPFTGPNFGGADIMQGARLSDRALPGVDPLTGGVACNDDSQVPLLDEEGEAQWPAPEFGLSTDAPVAGDSAAASAATGGSSAATAPSAVTPTLAPNSGQEQIIQWMTGLKADGSTTSSSFWSTSKSGVSWSWGAGATVTFAFDPGSNWSVGEQNAWLQGMAVWSGEANIRFQLVNDVNAAQVALARYRPGAVVKGRTLNTGAYEQWTGSKYTDSTFTKVQATGALISLQVSTPASGFGDITSYSTWGGYGVSTFMHELGHLMGLGHAGNYNGTISPATQQQNPYDVRTWTTMSYIRPDDGSAKYLSQYTPSGTAWGQTSDGYYRAPYTPMPLDIAGVQRLYGASTASTFSGGQIYGFGTNITYTTIDGTTDTISQFDFTKDTKPVITLYNSGLNNTLNLSGYSTTSVVDLRQGGYSSVAGLANNIGIAFGTHIDIAIGGSGNDRFILNDDGDIIDGGAGSDTVVLAGTFAGYTAFRNAAGGATVSANGIVHTLSNVEYLQFDDQAVAVATLPLPGTPVPVAAQLAIAATDASKIEGDSGSVALTFTVTRSANLTGTTAVNWAVSANGADAADFVGGVLPSGSVTFAAGETAKLVTVNVAGDTTVELDEGFTVTLSGATNGATITAATASGLIRNDDIAPATLSIAAASAVKLEGLAGAVTPFTFLVTRAGNTAIAASANWSVFAGSATITDFSGGVLSSGTVAFAAGETSKTITVNVAGDSTIEGDETFSVNLSAPNATTRIVGASASGTIQNDDSRVSFGATGIALSEGNAGTVAFNFTVTRIGYTAAAQTVGWSVTGTGVNPANAADFSGGLLPSGVVTFAAGETSKVISVAVAGDTAAELDETFQVSLSSATGGMTIGTASVTGTILNDDVAPAYLSIAAASAARAEGASGSTPLTFTVTRFGNTAVAAGATWTVSGTVSGNSANAADFVGNAFPTGSVSFAAGETVKTVTVNVAGDTAVEADEAFNITLSAPTGAATLATTVASGTILNDDVSVATLSIAAASAVKPEGSTGGATPFTFTVTRGGSLTGDTSATWSVAPTSTTPASASDFTGGAFPSGTVAFAAGESVKTVTVNVVADLSVEGSESFAVSIGGVSGGTTVLNNVAVGTIQNDDSAFTISASQSTKAEGNSGTTNFGFVVTRTGSTAAAQAVSWSVGGANVTAADFAGNVLPTGTVNFGVGESIKTIQIGVAGDTAVEADESFSVTLSNPTGGATIGTATASTIIANDDAALRSIGGTLKPLLDLLGLTVSKDLLALIKQDLTGLTPTAPSGPLGYADVNTAKLGLIDPSDPNHPLFGGIFG